MFEDSFMIENHIIMVIVMMVIVIAHLIFIRYVKLGPICVTTVIPNFDNIMCVVPLKYNYIRTSNKEGQK